MKMSRIVKIFLVSWLLLGGSSVFLLSAQAHNGVDDSTQHEAEKSSSVSPAVATKIKSSSEVESEPERRFADQREAARAEVEAKKEEVKEKRSDKKDELRIKRCEAKESVAKQRFTNIQEKGSTVKAKIDAKLARVKEFEKKKGITVENEAALLADVALKGQAVDAAISDIKASAAGFSCQNDDAKLQAELIKSKVEVFKVSVKAYRESLHTFFDAVRQAAEALESNSPSPQTSGGQQ
ncbi:MAG: hypothetical protein WCI47_01270 [bacterium]